MKWILMGVLVGFLSGCATPSGVTKQSEQEFDSLSREFVRSCTTIKDEPLETSVEFSTQPCYQRKNGIMKVVWDDNLLRAFKDRKTGTLTFQVYTVLYYKDWLFPLSANFGAANVQSIKGTRVKSDVDCGLSNTLGYCVHTEHFLFNLPFDELVRIEERTQRDPQYKIWSYRIKTQSGVDMDRGFNVNELLGFMDVVTGYRSKT